MNLSLSSWIKQLDSADSHLECALLCYKSAIASIRANLVTSDPTLKRQICGRLDRLATTVTRRMGAETLSLTVTRLDEILTEHRVGEEAVYQEEQIQLRRTLTALEDLVRTVSTRVRTGRTVERSAAQSGSSSVRGRSIHDAPNSPGPDSKTQNLSADDLRRPAIHRIRLARQPVLSPQRAPRFIRQRGSDRTSAIGTECRAQHLHDHLHSFQPGVVQGERYGSSREPLDI